MKTNNRLIIIPAWNKELSLPKTLEELLKFTKKNSEYDVLVVDDGSTDKTWQIIEESNFHGLKMPINLGVGAAMGAGFKFAKNNNYEAVLQLDADLQHSIDDVISIFEALSTSSVVIGSRFLTPSGYRMSFLRRIGSKLLCSAVNVRTKYKLTDVTSGFRAADRKAIELFSEHYPSLYLADTVESIILAGDYGLEVSEIPTEMKQRFAGKPSHNPIKSFLHLSRAILVIIATFQFKWGNNDN